MHDLATGTVTFLFTDVEGSTKLLRELGAERYAEALAEHRRVLRQALAAHGGVEVDTQGDAFFVAFPTAAAALEAAAEAQAKLSIPVRMGIHTGTPHLSEEGYVGPDVHLGARVAAAGHGGQVLLSRMTRELVDGELTELGEHRLKDFAEPVSLFQLGSERFPPLKTISNTNLPRPASSFVGRERELEEVTELLRDGARLRLLTLSGPGGSGKTRLAIEAASELVPEFKAGVFWVGLAPLRDPTLVLETIGQTLGAKDGLADHVQERELLLLLDNFEQVVEAGPELASLLEACPNLKLLVTSRELLRIRGEVEYAVPPLREPEAVELFCTRAQLEADETIADLSRRLDNLPLAVELAAARASVLSPAQILERLSGRLDLLKAGRGADPRQQTLRATIEWSYELLDEAEQRLFARLAVFAGGCALEAAEEVADADLDVLQSLVDKSLLRHTDARFWMLETIREYALQRLEASGEAEELRRRHADYFVALVEEAEPHLYRESQAGWSEWLDRVEAELDNVRAAVERFASSGEGEPALRLAGAASEFWCARQHVPEGRRYLERALSETERPTRARAKALTAAAHMARDSGDPAAARVRAEEALDLHRRAGDQWAAAHSMFWLGQAVADEGDFARAAELHEEASLLFTELGDEHYALLARRMLSWATFELGDRERARALSEDNLRRAVTLGSKPLEASILGGQTSRAVEEGRVEDALLLGARSLRVSYELGAGTGTPSDDRNVAVALCRCAAALALAEKAEEAAEILGCSEALHEELGVSPLPYLARENEQTRAAIRSQLDEAAFAAAWEGGRKLTSEEAVERGLSALGAA